MEEVSESECSRGEDSMFKVLWIGACGTGLQKSIGLSLVRRSMGGKLCWTSREARLEEELLQQKQLVREPGYEIEDAILVAGLRCF